MIFHPELLGVGVPHSLSGTLINCSTEALFRSVEFGIFSQLILFSLTILLVSQLGDLFHLTIFLFRQLNNLFRLNISFLDELRIC